MTETVEQLLKLALKLGSEERAALAAELIASLDGEPDCDAEPTWASEIERRAERARAGEDPGKAWPEARKRLRTKLQDR